jgi:hypothetical protein
MQFAVTACNENKKLTDYLYLLKGSPAFKGTIWQKSTRGVFCYPQGFIERFEKGYGKYFLATLLDSGESIFFIYECVLFFDAEIKKLLTVVKGTNAEPIYTKMKKEIYLTAEETTLINCLLNSNHP